MGNSDLSRIIALVRLAGPKGTTSEAIAKITGPGVQVSWTDYRSMWGDNCGAFIPWRAEADHNQPLNKVVE